MMTGFLSIALALIFGLLFTRITSRFKLPDVTAYLVAGVLIGPYCLGRLGVPGLGFNSFDDLSKISFISDAALGFIAFAIGSEFKLSHLKKTGKQAVIIGILQAVITTVVVDAVLIAVSVATKGKISMPAAITLGAIASATAPAATLMVVRQFKAKGKVTDVLLPVVALDDAVGLALFAVSFGIARAMAGGSLDVYSIVCNPIIEIVASLLLGAVAGVVL
ncbi:MAG: cation:proton antiporter, partial [Oscillospiraceae bacterium]|nr:cation:proton antiporter [Oscillospiraceae bacterium]